MGRVLVLKLNKTPTRGKPRHRWLDRVKKNLNQLDEMASIEDANNGDRWKSSVKTAKDLNGL